MSRNLAPSFHNAVAVGVNINIWMIEFVNYSANNFNIMDHFFPFRNGD